jgi:tetratricopeptide (TPR) repeat protein
MTSANASVPSPTPEQRRVAAGMFERANQVAATGNHDYGIRLLLDCCKLDPANLIYRQALRRTERARYKNNMRGSWLGWLLSRPARARLRSSLRAGEHIAVLEHGERILARNPWDVGVQMDMSSSADALGLLDLGVWILEQARQAAPRHVALNRSLAELYEKRGNFTQAIALWNLVSKEIPNDLEIRQKIKNLQAHDTIARGNYVEAATADPNKQTSGSFRVLQKQKATPPPGGDPTMRETSDLRTRLEADPTNAALHLQLARIHRRAGQLDQARAVLTQGLGPTGNAFELAIELADLETEPFRRNLAVTEEKLAKTPEDPQLRKIRSQLRKEVNGRELDIYRRKADRQPTDLSLRFELGIRLMKAALLDEAIRELQAAKGDQRLRWQVLSALGYCFKARNNWKLAERNFAEALEALPVTETNGRKEILFELAKGHADAGELAQALELAHELANLDFGYRDISRLLDEWQARLQQAS